MMTTSVPLSSVSVTAGFFSTLRVCRGDKGCSFPGCDRPPSWCQAHHIRHWIDGGVTDIDNLTLLCERHHHVVHTRGSTATATTAAVRWPIPARGHARTPAAQPIDLLTRLHRRAALDGESPRNEPADGRSGRGLSDDPRRRVNR